MRDSNASGAEKAVSLGGFAAGLALPGGGYGTASKGALKAGVKAVDKVGDVGKALKTITISPNKLTPTETPGLGKIQQMERSLQRNSFRSDHPVRYYEDGGQKYIVNGHHRTQAAKNLGIDVKAKPVNESYFQQHWGTTAKEFIQKAKKFTQQ